MPKVTFLILLLFAIIPAVAQDTTGNSDTGVQVRAFAFTLFEDIEKLQLRSADERVVGELNLPTGQLRARTSVSSRTFAFGVEVDDSFRVLGTTVLPDAGKDFILVLVPTSDGYHAFPIRADDPDFRGNDTVVFNFSKYSLRIMLGTAKKSIGPFKTSKLRPLFPADATFYQAMFAYEKGVELVPFNNTRWPVNPNTKALLFVFEQPSTGNLVYRSIIELAAH